MARYYRRVNAGTQLSRKTSPESQWSRKFHSRNKKHTKKKSSMNLRATQPALRFNTRTHPSSFPVCRRSGCCAVAAQWAADGRKRTRKFVPRFPFLCFIPRLSCQRHWKSTESGGKKAHAGTPEQLAQVLVRVPSSGIDSLGASLGPPTELQSFSCLAYPIY